MESKQLEDLIKEVNQVLVDSISKDLQQYESEAELWNTEVQSKIADRLANKIDTVRENTLFFNNEDYWNQ